MKIKGTTKCKYYLQYENGVMQGDGITLNQFLEYYINKLDKMGNNIEKMDIKNFIINNKVYDTESEVQMKLKIRPIEYQCNVDVYGSWYENIKCTVKNLLNEIAKIAEEYTCILETYMYNIKITVVEFKI